MHQQALYAKECEHEEAMTKLSEERQKTIDAKQALFEAAEAEHEAAMKAATEEHMLDIAAMQSEHEKAMEKAREEHQGALNAKEASHQLAITTTESAHNERISSMNMIEKRMPWTRPSPALLKRYASAQISGSIAIGHTVWMTSLV